MSDLDPKEGFARRWSRLKREPVKPTPTPAAIVEVEAPPIEMPPDAATIPLEDITAWLGRSIPEGWREIALRRMWSADLSIRDFIGPADYAWDWNIPGGAPGWGPMRAADDIVRLLTRAIGEDLPKTEPVADAPVIASAEAAVELPADVQDIALEEPPSQQPIQQSEPLVIRPRRGGKATPV
jgi:hypothetical protein